MGQLALVVMLLVSSVLTFSPAPPPLESIEIVPGTVHMTASETLQLQRLLEQSVTDGSVPRHAYYSVSALQEDSGWSFVSLVGLDELDPDIGWSVHDAGWFSVVLMHSTGTAALQGTASFSQLLAGVPDHVVTPWARRQLDPLARFTHQAGDSSQYRFPWESGKMMDYGSFGVHAAEEAGRVAVDLFSDGDTASGHAPNQVLAMESGVVDWVCKDDFQMGFRIGDLFYLHLEPNAAIESGTSLTAGDELGSLRIGSFNTQCGWAQQDEGWFHLHLTFPEAPTFEVEEWTLDIESETWHWNDEVRTTNGGYRESWLPTCISKQGNWSINSDELQPGESMTVSRRGAASNDVWYGGMGVYLSLVDNDGSYHDLGFQLVECNSNQPRFSESVAIPQAAAHGPATLRLHYDGLVTEIPLTVDSSTTEPPPVGPECSETADTPAYDSTWARTDLPVLEGQVSRTWMWGPEPFSCVAVEAYADSPGGERAVLYFDKARMEITNPNDDPDAEWYVTNGLLVNELITGEVQLGDAVFDQYAPADVNVGGDADDLSGPTYRTFDVLLGSDPAPVGSPVTQRVNRESYVWNDPGLAQYGVTAAYLDDVTNHTVASPFWEYMNSSGLVYEDGQYVTDQLFANPFYATGRPITEAYWAEIKVAGVYTDVLMQCFERRCLTYTPDNPDGWQVEAGNVGQHYYTWRYVQIPAME